MPHIVVVGLSTQIAADDYLMSIHFGTQQRGYHKAMSSQGQQLQLPLGGPFAGSLTQIPTAKNATIVGAYDKVI